MDKYVLDHAFRPVRCDDYTVWGRSMRDEDKMRVGLTHVGDAKVSTVFLGLDHGFHGGAPVLWETMVFGGVHDGFQDRYTSREEAIAGHEATVRMVSEPVVCAQADVDGGEA